MKREKELALLQELISLSDERKPFLDESVAHSDVERYLDTERFEQERKRILGGLPQALLHASELPDNNSFLRRQLAGLPLLLTRDNDGLAHAFLNVCRHRGTRLVDEDSGCKKRFTCPYHAWTFSNTGRLLSVPHEETGFPGLDRDFMGLKRLGCIERHGWIWINPLNESPPSVDDELSGLSDDFDWIESSSHTLLHSDEQACAANWKILVEGGLEAYHFKVAHRNTIGPYFVDNLSSYECFGNHFRSILARKTIGELAARPQSDWRLRDHAQILYTIAPTNALLVQTDHIAWIQFEPLAVDSTRIRVSTLVPSERADQPADREHWLKNHRITVDTLNEDFAIGESIQAGLASGANSHLSFGRFEGALAEFNRNVDNMLGD